MSHLSSVFSVIAAGVVAGVVAAGLTFGAAGIGWLVGSALLAGTFAMIVSAVLLVGFGGFSGLAAGVVGLSWAFADTVLGSLGISGPIAQVTMGLAYLLLGLTVGKTREEVVLGGSGPVVGSVIGIVLGAWLLPQVIIQGTEEAILSAGMIAAARAAREYAEMLSQRASDC